MKKVLFVATVTNHINAFHIPYLRMFKENGYEVHVASKGNEKIEYCDKHYEIPFERNPIRLNNVNAYKKLKKIIEENNYEIIHCHTPVGGSLTRLAARKARKKGTRVIYTAHGFHFYKGAPLANWLIFYPIEKYLAKYTDCLITINQEDYELAKRKFKKCKQVELIYGVGVEENKFNFEMTNQEKYDLRKNLGLRNDDFVLIQVGELNKNKNQIMAIKAMKELVETNNNIKLLLVGKGTQEQFYRDKIKEYNLQNNVYLLGYRRDVPELMKISNILLSLSYREGLPVNVMEGMASGLPIIATDCRGNRDLIQNKKNGFLIEMKNQEEYLSTIKKIYKDKTIRNLFSKENKKLIQNYLFNKISKKMFKIYFEKTI